MARKYGGFRKNPPLLLGGLCAAQDRADLFWPEYSGRLPERSSRGGRSLCTVFMRMQTLDTHYTLYNTVKSCGHLYNLVS